MFVAVGFSMDVGVDGARKCHDKVPNACLSNVCRPYFMLCSIGNKELK